MKNTNKSRNKKAPAAAKSVATQVKKAMSKMMPQKSIDTGAVISVTATGTFSTIDLPITQGTANGQRTGDEITIDFIRFRSTMYFGDPQGNVIRVIFLQVHGSSTGFAISDLLSNGSSGFPDVNSFYVPFVEGKRFTILHDEKYVMIPNASNSTKSVNWDCKNFIKRIPFFPGGGFAESGQTLMFTISDSGIIPNPALDFVYRIYYRDV
jgi:hypothetical protein